MASAAASLVRRVRSSDECHLLPVAAPKASSNSQRWGGAFGAVIFLGALYCCAATMMPSQALESDNDGRRLAENHSAGRSFATEPVVAERQCRDTSARCTEWASQGECSRNTLFMHKECAASCKLCTPSPAMESDANASSPNQLTSAQAQRCAAWAEIGECTKNPRYMYAKCPGVCSKRPSRSERDT